MKMYYKYNIYMIIFIIFAAAILSLIGCKEEKQADVVWGTAASSMLVLDERGQLEPYAPKGIERILQKFKSDKPVPTWAGITAWETAFIINTVELAKNEFS